MIKINKRHGTGEARKAKALASHETHRRALLLQARVALLRRLLEVGEATADDIRGLVAVPDHINPVFLGGVPKTLVQAGLIRRAGYRGSTRAEAHARPVAVWEIADRTAAVAWLERHAAPQRAGRRRSGPTPG